MTPFRFKEIRTELKLSKEGVAAGLGISRNSVTAYESGRQDIPKVVQLALMALKMGIPIV